MGKMLNNEILSDVKYELDIPIELEALKKSELKPRLGNWQKSFHQLSSFKDILVPKLLSIWDINIEDNRKKIRLDPVLNTKPDPETLVSSWMNKSEKEQAGT